MLRNTFSLDLIEINTLDLLKFKLFHVIKFNNTIFYFFSLFRCPYYFKINLNAIICENFSIHENLLWNFFIKRIGK